MRIVVAGGTGVAGKVVVRLAAERGHQVLALSRSGPTRGDLITGSGLAEALAGADAVIDCSNAGSQNRAKAERFFVTGTENLVRAAAAAGVGHHLLLSIVGIERVPMSYYQAKVAQEAALIATAAETGIGHTIARVTQFHEFAGQLLGRLRLGPLAAIPHLRIQPVELAAVAEHLLDLTEAGPAGRVPDVGGPRPEDLTALARQWVRHFGGPRVIGLPLAGKAARAIRDGALLVPGESGQRGRTFTDWLAAQPAG